ncbi:hypothetical protein [Catellatospora sichuanensis]|uniref:hypothetical protein n=1 Tax=Catellatospora sichuanensis TaxID=1969805 RepID=UPI0011845586|nr:hypothetical protein [Catellatospora sichuanensis]
MRIDEFRSEREFKVWAYSPSHGRLLLRSTMEGGQPSRIDLYFGAVDRMLLRPSYRGLRAAVADPLEAEAYRRRFGEIPDRYTLFTLEPDLGSFVVAGVMQSHEDTGAYLDTSFFGRFSSALAGPEAG